MRTSFLIPVYNTDAAVLRLCINSVLKSAGEQHEVIIIDDATSHAETRAFLDRCKASHLPNLTILRNDENCGVSYSLNKAVDAATGDMFAPVDHDDMVVESGFRQMFRFLIYYGVNWVYSDELQIDYKGVPQNVLKKPGFSQQLLRSVMYINHLQLIPRTLFKTVGGYREGFEGSQDHDLALRLSERSVPIHINTVAYLWRRGEKSLSVEYGRIGDMSIEASQRALEDHFQRLDLKAEVTPFFLSPSHELPPQPTGTFVSRILPSSVPKVSIVIPCKLGTTTNVEGEKIIVLEHCLQSIRRSLPDVDVPTLASPEVEIILVLNHEDDTEHADRLISNFGLRGFSLCDEVGFNFARKCNLGAAQAAGEILVILNDDTDFQTEGWTSHVISLLQEDDVACVGGMLLNNDRTVQSCGDNVGRGSAVHYVPHPIASRVGDAMHRYIADHETASITGAFLCCTKDTFDKFGGFSPAFPNSFQDVDFCLRARETGMRCIISPHVRLLHFESVSRNPIVESDTLDAIRQFHTALMTPIDPFAMWFYENPKVSLFSLTGLRYRLGVLKRRVRHIAFIILAHTFHGPNGPRGILDKNEWRVH